MKINKWDKDSWDTFVNVSPQGTVFCKSFYLKSYNQPVKYLRCFQGEETIAGFAFTESSKRIKLMPYQAYRGIIFKDLSNLRNYRRNLIVFNALECFGKYLFSHYQKVEFNNHWDIVDMRQIGRAHV